MDRPFLLELQCLQSRTMEGVSLCSNDVNILDRSSTIGLSSEMANTVNDIYLMLSKAKLASFWESVSAIINHSRVSSTRIMIYSIINSRIKKDWLTFDLNIR
jgi:hypothetical protein